MNHELTEIQFFEIRVQFMVIRVESLSDHAHTLSAHAVLRVNANHVNA